MASGVRLGFWATDVLVWHQRSRPDAMCHRVMRALCQLLAIVPSRGVKGVVGHVSNSPRAVSARGNDDLLSRRKPKRTNYK
jgi:hypothetical protein